MLKAAAGDFGCFITAAEWLDVNYGKLVRDLFLGELGGQGITVIEPTAQPFDDAATTAAIAVFEFGSRPTSILSAASIPSRRFYHWIQDASFIGAGWSRTPGGRTSRAVQ